ncbi:MAG: hypothetical protein IJV43_07545 [Oscillospiraceae bacterium]|nr:hypothetical protein [Oscillospiraceae bacterium]MBQ9720034.1 hypothetical protein [Oscillospiraceae bacterium]
MENNMNCGHEQDRMCTCIGGMNTARKLIHIAGNIRDVDWELDYGTLTKPGSVRLCIVGVCVQCGERLCYGLRVGEEKAGEELVESLYTYLDLFHRFDGLQLTRERFDRDFLLLFHEQDRPVVQTWLDRRMAI